AVGVEEHRPHAGMARGTNQPRHVAIERFHLDDISAVIAEHLGRIGPHQHGRHVDDPDALQWTHGVFHSRFVFVGPRNGSMTPRSRVMGVWGYAPADPAGLVVRDGA